MKFRDNRQSCLKKGSRDAEIGVRVEKEKLEETRKVCKDLDNWRSIFSIYFYTHLGVHNTQIASITLYWTIEYFI